MSDTSGQNAGAPAQESVGDGQRSSGELKSFTRHTLEALVLAGCAAALYVIPSELVERYYTNGFYRAWSGVASTVSDAVPFSLTDCAMVGVGGYAAYRSAKWVKGKVASAYDCIKKRKFSRSKAAKGIAYSAVSLVKLAAGGIVIISLLGGLNDRRQKQLAPIRYVMYMQKLQLNGIYGTFAVDQTRIDRLEQEIDVLREHADMTNFDKVNATMNSALDSLYERTYGHKMPSAERVKGTLLPLNRFSIEGFACLPLQECLVNVDEHRPDYELVMVLGHEKAHLKGFSDESEASLFAFRASLESGDSTLRYSALCYLYTMLERRSVMRIRTSIPAQTRQEIARREELNSRYQDTLAAEISGKVVDTVMHARGLGGSQTAYGDDTFWKLWLAYDVPDASKQ